MPFSPGPPQGSVLSQCAPISERLRSEKRSAATGPEEMLHYWMGGKCLQGKDVTPPTFSFVFGDGWVCPAGQ